MIDWNLARDVRNETVTSVIRSKIMAIICFGMNELGRIEIQRSF